MSDDNYKKLFPVDKRKEAFKVALDVRKFEIELYWKRTTYFWAFIGATFIGYNTLQTGPEQGFMRFVLSCLGLFLSLAWVLANRGSKQWQENWEHHVDHLEDDITGPLYKVTLPRARPQKLLDWLGFLTVGPSGHSVSKINQIISLYVLLLWVVLLAGIMPSGSVCNWPARHLAVLGLTALGLVGLIFGARTYLGPQGHTLRLRESKIE